MKPFFVVLVFLFVTFCSGEHNCIHDKIHASLIPPIVIKKDVTDTRAKRGLGSFRVHFDTSALFSDPERICTQEGERVKFGQPASTAECDLNVCKSNPANCNCYYTCQQKDVLTTEKRNFLVEKIIPDAKEYFQRALQVDQLDSNLVLSENTCGCGGVAGVSIPASYRNQGVDADLVVFISARTTTPLGGTIAFACSCDSDSITNRPVAGYINWGPNQLDLDPVQYPEQYGVSVHELTHVLGFSYQQYSEFVEEVTISNGRSVQVLSSPKVIEIGKKYFGCNTLPGVELENGGGSGTSSSHWERRILMNEYMTGYSSYDPRKTEFTLALLEDLGWYSPIYAEADPLEWGANKGCTFLEDRCNTREDPYFCVNSADQRCTWDGLKKGSCNLVQYTSPIPDTWDRYFTDPTIGGNDDFADYCPFIQYRSNLYGDCRIPENAELSQQFDSFTVKNFGEHFCPSCSCLNTVGESSDAIIGPSCHNITCVDGQLKIKIGRSWYDCNTVGQKITVTQGFDGSYLCPDPSVCEDVPNDNSEWPTIDSVEPEFGTVGTEVTIQGSNFGEAPQVFFGIYHSCEEVSVKNDTITCKIKLIADLPLVYKTQPVDVVIVTADGKTATEFAVFEMSVAWILAPTMWLLATILPTLTFL